METTPNPSDLCAHVRAGAWPFQTTLTLDEHLGVTDALVSCRHCGQPYLIEMLDWQGDQRLMRVSVLDPALAAGVVRNLTRGSCDLRRAGAEVHQLQTHSTFSPWLLLIRASAPRIDAVVPVEAGARLPGGSWRELPCDGSWVGYARSKTSITNG
ncbi:MAG: hypothetical protein ACNA7W_02600 [Pseudomonadales bacterium]